MVSQVEIERIWNICARCAKEIYGLRAPNKRYAQATASLLFGTAAQESGLVWERQRSPRWAGDVGGFGKWQVERGSILASLDYLRARPELLDRVTQFVFADPRAGREWVEAMNLDAFLWALRMDNNDGLGVALCRIHYLRIADPIPGTIEGQAAYWKKWYNTTAGAGTIEEYMRNWQSLGWTETRFPMN